MIHKTCQVFFKKIKLSIMKISLPKKLHAILIASTLYTATTNAQIVYTDVNPDKKFSSSVPGSVSYSLDLNKDRIVDFTITYSINPIGCRLGAIAFNHYVYITSHDSNAVATDSFAGIYALKMPLNQDISSNIRWSHSTLKLVSKAGCTNSFDGAWRDPSDAYLGLKLRVKGNAYYGWVRLSVSVFSLSGSFTVKDYAYNSVASQGILAGQTSLAAASATSNSKVIWTEKDTSGTVLTQENINTDNTVVSASTIACICNMGGSYGCSATDYYCKMWCAGYCRTSCPDSIIANGPLSFCKGDSVILNVNGIGQQYQWIRNGTEIKGATTSSYIAKRTGNYKCIITTLCGINTSNLIKVTVKLCSNSLYSSLTNEKIVSNTVQLKIAPNPFSNTTIISFTLLQSQKVSIIIFDVNGRLIKTLANVQMQPGTYQLVWNARDEKGKGVDAGIYFLKMQTGNKNETIRLSVMK